MNELKISETNGIQSISARELYKGLEITDRFNRWFESLLKYGFEENQDFRCVKTSTQQNQYGGIKELDDYSITLDMAKQICMLQRSEIGKKYRTYLINLEKAWNNPEMVMKRALEYANKRAEQLYLECQIMQPKAEYYDSFADSSKLIEIGHLGKVTGIGSRNIFPLLVGKKIIYKKTVDGISYYEPYYDYEKYFKSVERTFCNPEGETKHRPQLYLTSKGFIHFQTLLSKTIEETADKWIDRHDAINGAKKEAEKVLDGFKNDRKFAAGVEGAKHVLWGD